jgi:hypothetical protein
MLNRSATAYLFRQNGNIFYLPSPWSVLVERQILDIRRWRGRILEIVELQTLTVNVYFSLVCLGSIGTRGEGEMAILEHRVPPPCGERLSFGAKFDSVVEWREQIRVLRAG